MTLMTSCLGDQCTEERNFIQYNPVWMTASQFRVDIETQSERSLEEPGKMYYYNDFLFINELGEGIHIYDNTDKSNPTYVVFYKIPGNFDLVIKNDKLIADNVIDLITIDISDMNNPIIINREEDYKQQFTNWEPTENHQYYAFSRASDVTEILDCSDQNFGNNIVWRGNNVFLAEANFALDNVVTAQNPSNSGGTGIGGSTARFTIVDDYMYAVDQYSLLSYDLSAGIPVFGSKTNIGWGIETIFPMKDKLFIGSNSGMFIYSLENPAVPSQLSSFQHARACDPVVVEGNTAYVTLRDGNTCQGFNNQLDVIDISNITNPKLIKTYAMSNPHGLSVHNDRLYLSEGSHGLKIFDVEDKLDIDELTWNKNITSQDVIYIGNDILMSISRDGFYQYDVSNPNDIIELSHIAVR